MNTREEFRQAAHDGPVRIDVVHGERHYVTVNKEGRAIVGPRVGGIRRHRKRWWQRAKKATVAAPNFYERLQDEGEAEELRVSVENAPSTPTRDLSGYRQHVIDKEFASLMQENDWDDVSLPPLPRRSVGARIKAVLVDRDWHDAVRHIAVDGLVWGLSLGLLIIFGKLVWMVLTW